ncbi:MAG: ABC transporter substrate-binding protein [Christensenellaceae bacterium]
MKKIISIVLAVLLVCAITACAPKVAEPAAATEAPAAAATEAPAAADAAAEPAAEGYNIAVLIKATDSTFWQKVGAGAEDYAAKNDGVTVTVQGPASEADIEESISLLENVILSKPDAIVIGSNADTGANAALQDAATAGIPVITVDTALPSDKVAAHLATDNIVGGELAAEAMVKYMKDNGKELKGKVAIVAAVAGVQTIIDRDGGFVSKMAELAPDIEVLEPIYVDNDIDTSMSTTENIITANGDELVGIYADNNHTGDGVARAIEQAELKDKVTVVAFDDDDEELKALKNGVIKALIIQDQHNMGYLGVEYAIKAIKGEEMEEFVDTGVKVTWPEDLK